MVFCCDKSIFAWLFQLAILCHVLTILYQILLDETNVLFDETWLLLAQLVSLELSSLFASHNILVPF